MEFFGLSLSFDVRVIFNTVYNAIARIDTKIK